jgi:hypothetical protein
MRSFHPCRTTAAVVALAAVVGSGMPGCSGSSEEETVGHRFSVVQEEGIPVALTQGGPKYEGELFTYEVDIRLKEDEREESFLYQPIKFVADEKGWFYVSDYGSGDVAVFDPSGRYQRRFGHKGQGPGEFQYPMIMRIQDGIVHLYDMQLRRSTRYSTEGEYLNSSRFVMPMTLMRQPGDPSWSFSGIQQISEDRYLVQTSMNRYDSSGYFRSAGAMMLAADGDTLWSLACPEVRVGETRNTQVGDIGYLAPVTYAYGPNILSLYVPALGIVVETGWEGELEVYDLEGRLTRKIRVDGIRQPVTEADRAVIKDYYTGLMEEAENDQMRDMLEQSLKNLLFPEMKAAFGSIKFDDRGYLYVGTQDEYGPLISGEKGIPYHVFSPEGEYLGKTRRPGGRSSEVADGHLLVIAADPESTENLAIAYKMVPIPPGFRYP